MTTESEWHENGCDVVGGFPHWSNICQRDGIDLDQWTLSFDDEPDDEMHWKDCGVAGGFPHHASMCRDYPYQASSENGRAITPPETDQNGSCSPEPDGTEPNNRDRTGS